MTINLKDLQKIKVINSDDVYKIMQRILSREEKIDRNREHFWIVGLANDNSILFIELISLGSVNKIVVEPMDVFSFALQKRAVAIILVHNHPSGGLTPSAEDKDITDRLIQVGIIVRTYVFDHLIISEKEYLSFADTGLLDELKKSTKYVPAYILKERYEKEAAALVESRSKETTKIAKKQAKLSVAKKMIKAGIAVKKVAEFTGLTVQKIKEIKIN